MSSILAGIVAGKFAESVGGDRQKALVTGFLLGSKPVGLGLTLALIKRDADQSPPPVATPAKLTITTPSLPKGKVGTPYIVDLAATGGRAPFTWTETTGKLPASLSLDPSGVLFGTPDDNDTFEIEIQVTDTAKTVATQNFNLVIDAASV